jgi:anti-anti-sigma factor
MLPLQRKLAPFRETSPGSTTGRPRHTAVTSGADIAVTTAMPLRESGPVVKLTEAAPPPPLEIDVSPAARGIVTVAVAGEIDMLTAAELRAALTDAMDSRRPRFLVVDLAGVTFLDAAGMTALVHARHHAGRLGAELRLVNVRRPIVHSLSVAGLADALRVNPP